ncbi:MAG TPA: AAA family ATPase, partial [Actinomycetes bacterium]
MRLLERDTFLASLSEYVDEAGRGEGRLVLVAGEAGVGKTALLERFEQEASGAAWAWGACDGSFTPRPLGPLFDIARRLGGAVLAACENGAVREELFGALLRQLEVADRPRVVVVEDVHWADEATLDLVRFLGRRLRDVPALVVVTYRDDGLAADHPLRVVLGDLATQRSARRMALPPLTAAAVAELARSSPVEPGELYRLTGGNPFFVSEVLRTANGQLPASARDAVLARVARLEPGARQVLDAAALVGSRVDPSMLAAVVGDNSAGLEACLDSGLVMGDEDGLRFRHELARLAVAQAVPAHRRTALHTALLAALRARGADDAVLAYHAEGAADMEAVLEHAPRAARRAAELASHREAAAQYERALRFADGADPSVRAGLYDGLGFELSMIDRWQDAADAWQAALPLWRAAGDRLREGDTLRRLSRAMWRLCRGAESVEAAESAMAVLEQLPPGPELARATVSLAGERMLAGEDAAAIELARRAYALAEPLGLADVMSDALNTEGCSTTNADGDGIPLLRRALDIALAAGLEEQSGRAYANLCGMGFGTRRYAEVEGFYLDGIAYLDDHDTATFANCLRGQRAVALEEMGRWPEALDICHHLLERPAASPINRITPSVAMATILLRRGDPTAWGLLDRATAAADGTKEPQWISFTRLARVEGAWLEDRIDAARADALRLAEVADRCSSWTRGATAVWLRRVGLPDLELPWSSDSV